MRVLERQGYRVLAAASGTEALEVANDHRGPIRLLLSDVVMPGLSGAGLAQQLTKVRPGIRVLFMSGYPDHMVADHGVLDQSAPLLEKPFSAAELVARVREALGGSAPTQPIGA
jgi:hypothetical protein